MKTPDEFFSYGKITTIKRESNVLSVGLPILIRTREILKKKQLDVHKLVVSHLWFIHISTG